VAATRKTLILQIHLRFEGEYIPADEVAQYAENWIDSGLHDRDDLRGWTVTQDGPVVETEIR